MEVLRANTETPNNSVFILTLINTQAQFFPVAKPPNNLRHLHGTVAENDSVPSRRGNGDVSASFQVRRLW